jgi:hypothetical protein
MMFLFTLHEECTNQTKQRKCRLNITKAELVIVLLSEMYGEIGSVRVLRMILSTACN